MTEFVFDVANPVLAGALLRHGDLVVSAEWEGECWDFLLSEEVRPEQTSDGFVCPLCASAGTHCTFPNLQALWCDHLFVPFEEWINSKLANAQAVALYRTHGATWARLVSTDGPVGSPAFLVAIVCAARGYLKSDLSVTLVVGSLV
jgi:hypothetical protein